MQFYGFSERHFIPCSAGGYVNFLLLGLGPPRPTNSKLPNSSSGPNECTNTSGILVLFFFFLDPPPYAWTRAKPLQHAFRTLPAPRPIQRSVADAESPPTKHNKIGPASKDETHPVRKLQCLLAVPGKQPRQSWGGEQN